MTGKHVVFAAVLVAASSLACKCGDKLDLDEMVPEVGGGASGGAASIEELGKRLVAEANEGNVDGIMQLFPTAEQAAEALECSGPNPIDESRQESREDLVEELAEMAEEGVEMELMGVIDEGDRETYAEGADVEGCTANMPLVVAEIEYKLRISMGDETEDEEAGFMLIQLGDGGNWYLIEPD
jgi:hypothetical protein